MDDFGKVLRELREKRAMTVNQLATYSGVSSGLISKIENNKRGTPKPNTLEKLAKGLKMPYEELMRLAGHVDGVERTDDQDEELATRELEEFLNDPNSMIDGKPIPKSFRDDILAYIRIQKAAGKTD